MQELVHRLRSYFGDTEVTIFLPTMPKEKKKPISKKPPVGPLQQKTLFETGHLKSAQTPPPMTKAPDDIATKLLSSPADMDTAPTPPDEMPATAITPPDTAIPPKRNSVGFAPENTVVEAGASLDTVCKQLAPALTTTSKRKMTLFLKVRLPVDKKPKDPTGAARLKLKELGELLIDQDPTAIFYKDKQTFKDEKDACTKLSLLPTSITGIQAFMNGFRPEH
jgi:hypothetical protein